MVRRARRQLRAHPARAGARLPRLALVRLQEFDPFWERVVRGRHPRRRCTPPTAATRATRATGPARSEMLPFRLDAFRMMAGKSRPIEDTMTALACHGVFTRFPDLRIAAVENGGSWVARS